MKTHYKTHLKSYKFDYNSDIEVTNLQGFSVIGEKNELNSNDSELLKRTLKENQQLLNILFQTAINNKVNQEKIENNLNNFTNQNTSLYNNTNPLFDNIGKFYNNLMSLRNNTNMMFSSVTNNIINNPSYIMQFNSDFNNLNNLRSSSYLNIKNIFEQFGGSKKPSEYN